MDYDVQDLVRSFGLPLVEFARARIAQNEVAIMPVEPGATRVFGIVRPFQRPAVRVTAGTRAAARGAVELWGDCTCADRRNCEHVVSVLLCALGRSAIEDETWSATVPRQLAPTPRPLAVGPRQPAALRGARSPAPLREPQADPETRAIAGWLDRVARAIEGRSDPESRGPDKHRLLYLVDVEPRGRRLTVLPVLAYVKKDGRYGSRKPCGSLAGPSRPAYVTAEDRELLPAIAGHASGYGSSGIFLRAVAIDAEGGAHLLERLLATGRCHWRDTDAQPLRLGPARSGHIAWTLDEDGRQRPRLAIDDGPEALGLGVEPPWYVDPRECVAGPLDLGLGTGTAIALLEAPGLTPEAAERVRETLTNIAAASRLPLPVPLTVVVHEHKAKPVPHLRLHLWRRKPVVRGWRPVDITAIPTAKLTFDYDGTSVRADQLGRVVQRVAGHGLVRVHRDIAFEEQSVAHLEALGFMPLSDVVPIGTGEEEVAGEFLPVVDEEDVESFLFDFSQEHVPRLREAGWTIEMADDYPFQVIVGDQQWYADVIEGTNQWFDLELGVEIEGERHSLLPILMKMLRDRPIDLDLSDPAAPADDRELALRTADGRLLVLAAERVRAILGTLAELFGDGSLAKGGALPLSVWNAPRLAELDETLGSGTLRWSGGEGLRELGRKLRDFRGMQEVEVPHGFRGTLRAYQRDGLNWLQFLREHDLAGVLADDMGLGKTVQLLAHLLTEKRSGRMDRPSLVVAPTSVVTNWRREAEAFTPDLRVLVLQGQSRRAHFDRLAEYDLVLTTYALLARDETALRKQLYHALILDEAQFVKNAKTKAAAAANRLEARHRLCLTGTPMENHLGELWSLFHFLMPGLLGDAKQFRRLFRTPIEKHDDRQRREQLVARVRPFLLRRTKDQVATELPPKTEMTRSIELARGQRDLYESIRLAMNEKVRKEIARRGLARSTIIILDALLKLRQVCCDPRLLKIKEARSVTESAKLAALMEMLPELLEEGRRILLFSQFTSMIELIEHELRERDVSWVRISGDTRDRDTPVRRFQAGEVPLFLISLKAGGTGLNLTAADTVIHYDPWWNPAVEDQATDRAHRIGQDKPVFVYRLIVTGSVEEKMLALQARKRELAEGVYGTRTAQGRTPLSADDLEALFRPLE